MEQRAWTLQRMEPFLRPSVLASGLAVTALLAGCGSDAKPAVCKDVEGLQKTVAGIRDVPLTQGAGAALKQYATELRSQLTALKSDAKAQYASELAQLDASVSALSSSVDTAQATPGAASLAGLATSTKAVGSATKALASAVSSTC